MREREKREERKIKGRDEDQPNLTTEPKQTSTRRVAPVRGRRLVREGLAIAAVRLWQRKSPKPAARAAATNPNHNKYHSGLTLIVSQGFRKAGRA